MSLWGTDASPRPVFRHGSAGFEVAGREGVTAGRLRLLRGTSAALQRLKCGEGRRLCYSDWGDFFDKVKQNAPHLHLMGVERNPEDLSKG